MANLLGFVTFFLCFDKVEYNNSIFLVISTLASYFMNKKNNKVGKS